MVDSAAAVPGRDACRRGRASWDWPSTVRAVIARIEELVFAHDAEAARAFFRDVLDLPALDEGDGWLYFALPPAELACHPGPGRVEGREEGRSELYLMCTDVAATRAELESKGVEFT